MDDRRVFVAVANAGSYQAAAHRLQLARTTVMRRVEALEAEVGLELVQRSGRTIALTEAGRQLADGLRGLYSRQDKLEAHLRAAAGEAAGTIRLVGPELGTGYGLVDPIAAFVEAHPSITVHLELGRDMRALRPGEFDVALQLGHRINPDLLACVLFQERMILAASPRYLEAFGVPERVEDLAEHRIVEERDARGRVVPWRLADGTKISPPAGAVAANGIGVVMGLALEGVGVARLPRSLIGHALVDGALETVLPEIYSEDPVSFVYFPGPSAATRAFLDFMTKWDHRRRWEGEG
ncbi:MAG: LysR family transcriptional regulator [Deltaproteobacteria bacterium]